MPQSPRAFRERAPSSSHRPEAGSAHAPLKKAHVGEGPFPFWAMHVYYYLGLLTSLFPCVTKPVFKLSGVIFSFAVLSPSSHILTVIRYCLSLCLHYCTLFFFLCLVLHKYVRPRWRPLPRDSALSPSYSFSTLLLPPPQVIAARGGGVDTTP